MWHRDAAVVVVVLAVEMVSSAEGLDRVERASWYVGWLSWQQRL